jgi:TfoX/Sxy family transcriptional regulator of competence genes
MAYDEDLANGIRQELTGEPGLTERKMFGGLGFMLDGNMAVAASGQGGLMVRVDPETCDPFLAEGAEPMQMQGRAMRGWLLVAPDLVDDQESVARWVGRGAAYARTLPPK